MARIREAHEGTQVSVVATPWDQALANRVPLDLGAVAPETLDAKLAMAEVVLRGVDRVNRRRLGLPDDGDEVAGFDHEPHAEPPRWYSQPASPRPAAEPADDPERADVASAAAPGDRADWPFRGPG